MPKTKLTDDDIYAVLSPIADAMKQMALERAALTDRTERRKPIRHIFTRGARVYLWYLAPGMQTRAGTGMLTLETPQWKLAVARDGTFPSDDEMKIFRRAFGVDGIFFTDAPQIWQPNPNDVNPATRYAFVLRWFAK